MSELVKKTASAIAVSASLTTLIDWVNIEQLSGFTVIVNNAGGGSADDITDVTIDTSDDGGITSSLDQHADTPAVPVASGAASVDTFTETAKFIRIRAKCTTDEDTTAEAVLLADTSTGRICTLSDVRDRLGIAVADTDNDTAIAQLITNLESLFNAYCNRQLILNSTDATQYYTGQGARLQLLRYPIVSVTSIKVAYDYDFDSATALTANTDYRIIAGGLTGILFRMYIPWESAEDSIQIIYKAGYCAAGQSPADDEFAMPGDLREACIEQTTFLFKRRDDIGLSSVGMDGGSFSKFAPMDLLPMVKKTLDRYRRPQL